MTNVYDAIIVGGGPAGATSALLLAKAGWKVAVIEKAQFPRRKVCGEFISETSWPLLAKLGVANDLIRVAGPVVRRVGVFAGARVITSRLAAACDGVGGRAVAREHLDTLLLQRARAAGAEILQPWTLTALAKESDYYDCCITQKGSGRIRQLYSHLIIAAHGSWEHGVLPTNRRRIPARATDLFGFKAHFARSTLPQDLMPLIAFPGGYGGMVHTGNNRVSLSCCIRRDQLARCRQRWPHVRAGETVLTHIRSTCKGAADVMQSAQLAGAWLSAGPLRTGIHSFGEEGIFAVGNAAAEAHPIVAEGISMALQSAFLLCTELVGSKPKTHSQIALDAIRNKYEIAWRENFSARLRVAAVLAHVFMHPSTAGAAAMAIRCFPQLLTEGSRWSGKAQAIRNTTITTSLAGKAPWTAK